MKRVNLLFLTVLMLFSLVGCGAEEAEYIQTENTLDTVYRLSPADLQVQADVQDITLDGQAYKITQAGAYRLSGDQEGQLLIDVQDEIVHLILEDANLRSYNGPVICVDSGAKLVLTVPEGTAATLTDSGFYEGFTSQDACIFSAGDLTINGTGTLEVRGNFADGIRTKDVLKILGTTLTIRAKGDGLRGADGVILENTNADIQCEGHGIFSSKENKPGRGFTAISGGSIAIIAGEYGLNVGENLYIRSCEASVYGVLGDIRCQGSQDIQEGYLQ